MTWKSKSNVGRFTNICYICTVMKNEYHRNIIAILLDNRHQGLTARDIARQIYNLHYGLFATDVTYHELHRQVRLYLWHQSRRHSSPFERTGWATYAIRPDFAVQLDFLDDLWAAYDKTEAMEEAKTVAESNVEARQLLLF